MNVFSITSVIIFFSSFGFGLSVYSSDRQSKINRTWLTLTIFIGLWSLGLFGVTSVENPSNALLWQYLLDAAGIFIPVAYFSFASELVRAKNHGWRLFSYILAGCLAIFSFTPYFKIGMIMRYSFYWINPGPFYFLFPLFYSAYVIVAAALFFRAYRLNPDPLFRAQVRNTLFASLVGFGGGVTNFFPQIINIYPFGNYFVLLYVFFMSYAVLRYKMLSAKVLAAQIFAGGMVLVFLFNLLQSTSLSDWVVNFILFVLMVGFSILFVRSVYQEVHQREKIELQEKELEAANEQQENFIHFLSHEVKGILGKNKAMFAFLLEDDGKGRPASDGRLAGVSALPPDIKPLVLQSLNDTDQSVDMVVNILRSADLKTGNMKLEMKSFDFETAVLEAVTSLKIDAERKGLKLNLIVEPAAGYMLKGDREALATHVVRNLIDNAVRYTQAGKIEVRLSHQKSSGAPTGNAGVSNSPVILFSVSDTGVGITPEDRSRLFTEGGHGKDSIKVNVHSTGYGLYFAKGIVEAHGGRTWAESEGAGKGSSFFVELPIR